ncbi:hypothetical protein ACHAXR_006105 [Thalassiosira sp. AJA248-18]
MESGIRMSPRSVKATMPWGTNSGFRCGMGWFILLSLLANFYVILMFHRFTGQQQQGEDLFSFGKGGPLPPSRWQRRDESEYQGGISIRQQRENDDDDDDDENDDDEKNAEMESLQDKLAESENDIEMLKKTILGREERASIQLDDGHKPALLEDQSGSLKGDNEDGVAAKEIQPNQSLRRRNNNRRQQNRGDSSPYPGPRFIPNGWEEMGFHSIRQHYRCRAHAHDQTKPLPSLEDWQFLRDMYKKIVDENANFEDDPVPPTEGYTFGEGGPPPFYAKHSTEGRGRGLFASRDIKKGELVHDGNQSDFTFPNAMAWRRFIFALKRKKACDVIDWTWTQQTEENGPYKIFSAMNISILLNGGDESDSNIMPPTDTSSKMYATKDIRKDEELLSDYYIYDTVWDQVGL